MNWWQALDPLGFDFKGRLGLREYLVFSHALSTLYVLLICLSALVFAMLGTGAMLLMLGALHLLLLPCFLSISVRRLHDTNRSGRRIAVPFAIATALVLGVFAVASYLLSGPPTAHDGWTVFGIIQFASVVLSIGGGLTLELLDLVFPALHWPGHPGSNQYGAPPPHLGR